MAAFVAGCGDKVPESEASRRAGAVPKQAVEKAAADVNKALERGTQRLQDEPK